MVCRAKYSGQFGNHTLRRSHLVVSYSPIYQRIRNSSKIAKTSFTICSHSTNTNLGVVSERPAMNTTSDNRILSPPRSVRFLALKSWVALSHPNLARLLKRKPPRMILYAAPMTMLQSLSWHWESHGTAHRASVKYYISRFEVSHLDVSVANLQPTKERWTIDKDVSHKKQK